HHLSACLWIGTTAYGGAAGPCRHANHARRWALALVGGADAHWPGARPANVSSAPLFAWGRRSAVVAGRGPDSARLVLAQGTRACHIDLQLLESSRQRPCSAAAHLHHAVARMA